MKILIRKVKEEFKEQIINSLKWIGINYEGDEYIQSKKIQVHVKVANELLKKGNAYKCYCSTEEIEDQKKKAKQKKFHIFIIENGEIKRKEAPENIKPVIRFKVKLMGVQN